MASFRSRVFAAGCKREHQRTPETACTRPALGQIHLAKIFQRAERYTERSTGGYIVVMVCRIEITAQRSELTGMGRVFELEIGRDQRFEVAQNPPLVIADCRGDLAVLLPLFREQELAKPFGRLAKPLPSDFSDFRVFEQRERFCLRKHSRELVLGFSDDCAGARVSELDPVSLNAAVLMKVDDVAPSILVLRNDDGLDTGIGQFLDDMDVEVFPVIFARLPHDGEQTLRFAPNFVRSGSAQQDNSVVFGDAAL